MRQGDGCSSLFFRKQCRFSELLPPSAEPNETDIVFLDVILSAILDVLVTFRRTVTDFDQTVELELLPCHGLDNCKRKLTST